MPRKQGSPKKSPSGTVAPVEKPTPARVVKSPVFDDGACDRCDGSGHSQTVDGQFCSKCGGSGRLDLSDEDE